MLKLQIKPATAEFDDLIFCGKLDILWQKYGPAFVEASQRLTRLDYEQVLIHVRAGKGLDTHSGVAGEQALSISSDRSWKTNVAGTDERSDDDLVSTLTHELCHWLLLKHDIVAPEGPDHNEEAHKHIYLFLYDVWAQAYGQDYAEALSQYELAIDRPYYKKAWQWAMALSPGERRSELEYLIANKKLRS